MKFNRNVTSSRRKKRKARYTASSVNRRKLMVAPLSKDLREQHQGVRNIPVRKDDEVKVVRGAYKNREGKVLAVYRKRWVIHIEKIQRERANGQQVQIPIDPSNVVITKLKMDNNSRKKILDRKAAGRAQKMEKGKHKEVDDDVQGVD